MQAILILGRFCICKYTYLLRCVCNLLHFHRHSRTCAKWQQIWVTRCASSQLRLNKAMLCLCFSFYTINKCLFHGIFAFLCFLLLISLFKMAPTHNAEVLPTVLRCKKTVMCLREKICVFRQEIQTWVQC